jgi:YD repeat-containing protein
MTASAICATEHAQLRSRSTGKERDAESGNDYFELCELCGELCGDGRDFPQFHSNIRIPSRCTAEGYDAVGNVTGYTDSVNGSWSFSYDTLNRLATATGSQPGNLYPNACWQYDTYGNRLWQTTSATAYTPSQNGGPNPCPVEPGPSSWAKYDTTWRPWGI